MTKLMENSSDPYLEIGQNPIWLSAEEISDPYSVIHHFFEVDNLAGHRADIKEWHNFLFAESYYVDSSGSPSGLMYIYECHIKLMEAASLITQINDIPDKSYNFSKHEFDMIKNEFLQWNINPFGNQLENPYQTINAIFKSYSVRQYRNALYKWLVNGLCSWGTPEEITPDEVKEVYHSLEKLQEAAWLIYKIELNGRTYN
jgi:flagellin-specific chaperone FliS